MPMYRTPGVYREEIFPTLAVELRTGVPAFLGFTGDKLLFSLAWWFQRELDNEIISRDLQQAFADQEHSLSPNATLSMEEQGAKWRITDEDNQQTYLIRKENEELNVYAWVPVNTPQRLELWSQFEEHFGVPPSDGYLAHTVRGFFENGGDLCYVVRLDDAAPPEGALRNGLAALEPMYTIDLVCAPDIMKNPTQAPVLQQEVLEHCEKAGDRFALLDALPDADLSEVLAQRQALRGTNGALYYPWIQVSNGSTMTDGFVPPCGHVAGVYARSDRRVGIHKAPANEVLEGVLDLEINLTDVQQDELNPWGINCLRAFPGRGVRVWGARTLSHDPAWTYINVRRLFLTAGRWIERNMAGTAFEPNDARLWARITRELMAYFTDLFRRGALKGRTPQEAFYIKCDAETNPPDVREAGRVVTEIGLAPALPAEFVVVRIIHSASGTTITTTPTPPPTSAPPPSARPTTPSVRITYIEYNPEGPDVAGEYVLIENQGEIPKDLTNWTLSDLAGHTFVFPAFTLEPGASVWVWTGRGGNTATDLYWSQRAALWNNIGDKAYLRDSRGVLVDECTVFPLDDLLSS